MNSVADCTVSEKVLLAAFALEEEGKSPFSAEALVVSAWRKYPQTFGLRDYTDLYPDSNKVLTSIMGERGLARRGWLAKLGRKQYALTREGRQTVRKLLHEEHDPVAHHPSATVLLSREQERRLLNLLATTALAKFQEDRRQELSFADACRFWGITENLSGSDLDERLKAFRNGLLELDRLFGNNGEAILQGGRSITGEDIGQLDQLHAFLEQRFGRHLALLRNRAAKN
jgi:hypothetical protein